jgi:hypothetical protein
MPLTDPEKVDVAEAFLSCFGEDGWYCGHVLAYVTLFTVGSVDLVQAVKDRALTWQPFIDAGTSIDPGYVQEVQRGFDQTTAGF